jgi:ketosteroid isomerase-like protein
VDDIETRLRAIEDRFAISDLRSQYNHRLDSHDDEGFVDLFTEDVHIEDGPIVIDGRPMLREMVAKSPEMMDGMWHYLSNEETHIDGDTGWGTCYFNAPHVVQGKALVGAGRYLEKFVRCDDGRWRFRERRVVFFFHYPVDDLSIGSGPVFVPPAHPSAEESHDKLDERQFG